MTVLYCPRTQADIIKLMIALERGQQVRYFAGFSLAEARKRCSAIDRTAAVAYVLQRQNRVNLLRQRNLRGSYDYIAIGR